MVIYFIFKNDVLDIMVADKIQSFYGMDREAVRAAMIKLNFSLKKKMALKLKKVL